MMVMLVFVVLILLLLFVLYWYHTKNFNYWSDRGVLFIKPHWLFGSFKDSILQSRSWPQYCRDVYNTYKDDGFVGTYIFRRPSIFILDPQLLDKILLQDFMCFEDRGVPYNPREPLFESPFYLKGDKWRALRHQLLPAFTFHKIKDMFNQVSRSVDNLLNNIDQCCDEDGVDVEQAVFLYASDVIASCTFGIHLQTHSALSNQFLRAVKLSTKWSPWKISKQLLAMVYPHVFQWFEMRIHDKFVTDFFLNVTKSTVKYREDNKIKRNDFLQSVLLLKQSEEEDPDKKETTFSNNCIASFMFSFVVSGVALEEGTISFALYELARNPLIQNKLYEEVHSCISKHGALTFEAIRDMTYLDQVLQETLRMYTVPPVLTRDVTSPYRLPGTDVILEEGMSVIIPSAAIHMDPRYYPSPEKFNPDRFIDNNYKANSVFLPFGQGPRMCLAVKFAVMIMKVCIATIVSKYDVRFGKKITLPVRVDENRLFVKSERGIWLTFHPRSVQNV